MDQRPAESENWTRIPESGTVLGISFLLWSATVLGRWLPRLILWPVSAYYYLTSRRTRQASQQFQRKIRGREATKKEVFINILRFAEVALDRVFFSLGRTEKFSFKTHGHDYLQALAKEKKGGLLLGAHLGSFAAMSGAGSSEDLRINAIVYNENSRVINGVLEKFGRKSFRVIDISQDRISAILKVRKRIEKGEMGAILIDRVLPGSQSVQVDFLGQKAAFSTGAFVLASLLKCPVYLVFGLYRGGNRYDLHCEPFSERVILPKGDGKNEALKELAQAYANRLEVYCQMAPDNWFNFFDFWESSNVQLESRAESGPREVSTQ